MHAASAPLDSLPALPDTLDDFDTQSGSLLERAVFNHRRAVMLICALVTVLLAVLAATRLSLSASFEKMIPRSHPYIQAYLENRAELRGLGNALRIVVENKSGDIDDARYQQTLGTVAHQVPGRHGHAAGLHVRVEHGGRGGADPHAVALSAANAGLRAAAPGMPSLRVLGTCADIEARRVEAPRRRATRRDVALLR